MKNLVYIFRLENKEGEEITSVVCDTFNNACFIISRLLEEGHFKIHAPAKCIPLDVIDYDC